jgi:nicotinate-nucleotide adenylyltransferase
MRFGILGGTFDPPHDGHLLIARAAKSQLSLDRALFAPAGMQPLKPDRPVTPAEQRAEMVRLAIAGEPGFELCRLDLDRPGPHYTVDLLRIVSGIYPGAELWFLIGGDSLADLLRWRDPQQIIELARLAVVRRPGSPPDWTALDAALPDLRGRIDWIDTPPIDISGTEIRRRVRDGEPIDELLPAAVARYILENGLYRR